MGSEVIKVQHKVYEVSAKILIKLYRLWNKQTEQKQQIAMILESFVIFPCLAKQNIKNRNPGNHKSIGFKLFTVL